MKAAVFSLFIVSLIVGVPLARADEQGRMRIPQGRGQFLELAPPTPFFCPNTVVYERTLRATRLEPVAEPPRHYPVQRLHSQRAK